MGVDHGGGPGGHRQVPQNLEWGVVAARFCHVAKFWAPYYLHYNVGKCVFCLYSRTFIVSPAMRPPRIPVRSTPIQPTGCHAGLYMYLLLCRDEPILHSKPIRYCHSLLTHHQYYNTYEMTFAWGTLVRSNWSTNDDFVKSQMTLWLQEKMSI